MKLYDNPPRYVLFDGKKYRLRAPFDAVLFCYDALKREDISGKDKIKLCSSLLFPHLVMSIKKREKLLDEAFKLLSGDEQPSNEPPYMDFEQDAPYIRAAFRQQYGIDLDRERGRMSWFTFCDLLGSLTDETLFCKIVQIRACKVPPVNKYNREDVQELLRQKAIFAIKTNKNKKTFEQQVDDLFDKLYAMAKEGE